jgi:hypothetical protein
MVATLMGAGLDERALVAESGGCQAEVTAKMIEGLAANVPQLDVLEVMPDALVRVQVRGVAGERLQADALRSALSEEVLDRLAAMDRCAVPDDQELAGDVPQQVFEEADDVRALVGALLDEHQQPPRRGDAADDRQVVAAQRQTQDRRLPARGVGPDGPGQQVEAGLVDPDDGPPLLVRPFFRAGQRSVYHASIAASLRWLARRIGFWTLQPAARRSLPT